MRMLAVQPAGDVAEQEVALVDDQESVEDEPKIMEVGVAERVTVGAEGALTATIVACDVEPPGPVQERV